MGRTGFILAGLLIVLIAGLLRGGRHAAAAAPELILKPAVYDPFGTRLVKAEWRAGTGLPDADGASSYALRLWKGSAVTAREMALAELRGVAGLPLRLLAFDIRMPESGATPPAVRCSFASPRFQILSRDAGIVQVHSLGCARGFNVASPAPGWTTLEFWPDEFPPLAADGRSVLLRVTLVLDEAGEVLLDNIRVNDIVITKPGVAR